MTPDRIGRTRTAAFYAVGLVGAVLFLFPLVWAAVTSLKTPQEAASVPPTGLPSELSVDNYAELANYGHGIVQHAGNSLVVSLLTVVITGVVATLAGYGFSRLKFPGAQVAFVVILAALMVPFQTIIVAIFSVLRVLDLTNSLLGLALVYSTFQMPFAVFMMRNSFDAVPKELEEAALVDGCGRLRALWSVTMPVVAPAIVTVALFAFLASWNEFFAALILLSDSRNFTLPLVLMNAQTGNFGTIDWGAQQAGVTMTILPVVVIFLVLQRHYVRGLISGALKS